MNPFKELSLAAETVKGLQQSFAVIEFKPNGQILTANALFCDAVGYRLDEIQGREHAMFVEPTYASSDEYQAFWAKLRRGEIHSGAYRRVGKNGKDIWLEASYTPVRNFGKVVKVVKLAQDITAAKRIALDDAGKLAALSRSQAIVEFDLQGNILTANDNFLRVVNYCLDEIVGRHHSLFMADADVKAPAYREFWEKLGRGEFFSDKFRRVGKDGREIWLQASYNPILDVDGRVMKVVKFATDLTATTGEMSEIGRVLSGLAGGDLAIRLDRPFMSSLEPLRLDFNAAAQSLQEALQAVAASAGAIHSGSEEISSATDDLSRRTEQQAANLEQTAAALDEITTTVKKTSQGASQAREAVMKAKADAELSGATVRDAVDAMSRIENSSKQIGQIIGVIDEIAFQTNLLALNAGVEAARAGDAGRGFAVVASEVRALAQRSAEAAKEIKALISASGQEVSSGVSLVGDAGRALERIAKQVSDITGVVGEIAASAQEQATALNEVNTAINQMDQVTQQNAAMVEQTTAASHSLAGEAEDLSKLISRFKVGQSVSAQRMSRSDPSHRTQPALAVVGARRGGGGF